MSSAQQKELFRLSETVSKKGISEEKGTGMGLNVSRELIERSGEKIWVESEPGEGASFYFTLPFQIPSGKREGPEETLRDENPNWNAKTFLLVEDDPVSIEYLKEALYPTNVNILVAETGHQAMEQFNKHVSIDLILMDLKLPDISGLEIIREIRKTNRDVPILAQTAHAMSEDRNKCIQAGADEYISKPIAMDELLAKISRLI